MDTIRLGVNIDHIATLRQARGESYPSLVEGARAVLESGADQITIHLREDRRHIQDYDVPAIKLVTQRFGVPLNLEMGAGCDDITAVAIDVKPEWVCLVPEKREEKTTEGGLDLLDENNFNKIKKTCQKLKESIKDVKISLFVEAKPEILSKCIELELIDAVEIHTGDYAMDFIAEKSLDKYYEQYKKAFDQMKQANISFHAGHGLTDESVVPLLELKVFSEYNIGHWIICQSVFEGLANTTNRLKQIIIKER